MDFTDTEQLVGRARRGDATAFEALFARAAERLLVYLQCRLGPTRRAEVDVWQLVHETCVEAGRSLAAFRGPDGAFPGWLYQVADARLASGAPLPAPRPAGAGAPRVRAAAGVVERLRAEEEAPSDVGSRREARERLVRAMDALAPEERQALLLRHFHGRSLEEVASALGTPQRDARRLLGRAHARLGAGLEAAPP